MYTPKDFKCDCDTATDNHSHLCSSVQLAADANGEFMKEDSKKVIDASLEFGIRLPKTYTLDTNAIESLEDVKKILKVVQLTVTADVDDFELIEHLLIEVDDES